MHELLNSKQAYQTGKAPLISIDALDHLIELVQDDINRSEPEISIGEDTGHSLISRWGRLLNTGELKMSEFLTLLEKYYG